MNTGTLCIIQARLGSTRLPDKMLLPLGGESLIARAWRMATDTFGDESVVIACPAADVDTFTAEVPHAEIFGWDGPADDLLGRFYACANRYRWHPDTVIVRWTPDDPFKSVRHCLEVEAGARHPVELGCEAFTLQMLRRANAMTAPEELGIREHLSRHPMLFAGSAPPCPEGVWTIDTEADYEAAQARIDAN